MFEKFGGETGRREENLRQLMEMAEISVFADEFQ